MNQYKITLRDNSKGILLDTDEFKSFRSKNYNFNFNKKTGFFARWGKTFKDDVDSNIGTPEIADIEISTICEGIGEPCKFCYKSNTEVGENMTLDTFKKVFEKLPKTVNSIAFGIGNIDANPDLFKIFDYTKSNGVIPTVTINGARMTNEYYDKLASYNSAVAVSYYSKNTCFNSIKELTDRGLKQTNIHFFLSEETYDKALSLIDDVKTDERLKNLNAIVFLSLKKKGNAHSNNYNSLSQDKFNNLVKICLEKEVNFGFDSCSAFKFLNSVKEDKNYNQYETMSETCESTQFSIYIDVKGDVYPCSFTEGFKDEYQDWTNGISILECNDFFKEVWWNEKLNKFRDKCIDCKNKGISCSIYNI